MRMVPIYYILGSLCEYMVHLLYKWLNYGYVVLCVHVETKDVVWEHP